MNEFSTLTLALLAGLLLGAVRMVRFGPDAVGGLTALVLWGSVAFGGQFSWASARLWMRTVAAVAG